MNSQFLTTEVITSVLYKISLTLLLFFIGGVGAEGGLGTEKERDE